MGHREAASAHASRESRKTRDIGEIPCIVDEDRREKATASLTAFCEEYQPFIFSRPFAPVHLSVIERLETAVNTGGLFSYAMPRGAGKTCLAEAACLWAVLTGKRRYVVLISATEKHATQSLGNIKKELGTNDRILEGWPEVVYPIHALEGIAIRCTGQLHNGNPTHIVWRGEQLVLPMIPGSQASGSVIEVRGLTGAIRGMKANLPGGQGSIRPELVVLDDPQTNESARSPSQCVDRENIILGAVLGLAGHEHQIAAVLPCTVMHKGDLADRFTDQEKHPEWHGVRTKLMLKMPSNMKLWDEYHDIRRNSPKRAKEFYIMNRDRMDEGAEPIWDECYNKSQISAIQHAMDLKALVGELAFASEYQNDPLDDVSDGEMATVEDIIKKVTQYKRGEVPPNCQHLTMYTDVHARALYWAVCGWDEKFNGHVIDYGIWPETKRRYFTLRDVRRTLQGKYLGRGEDGAIFTGISDLVDEMLGRSWGKVGMRIERCIVDANWKTSVIKAFCRESLNTTLLLPGHGRYIGGSRQPMSDDRKATGDRAGHYWKIPSAPSREGIRHIIYDINYWKSFINTSLITSPGERGCLQLFDFDDHKLFAEHLTAEFYIQVSGRGRVVNEWKQYPGRDNHWFDCLVGCAVAASLLGCRRIDSPDERPRRRMRVRELKC